MTARDDAIARHPASTAWHEDADAACIRWTADQGAHLARVARIQAATRELIADEAARQDPIRAPRGIVLAVLMTLTVLSVIPAMVSPLNSGGSLLSLILILIFGGLAVRVAIVNNRSHA